MTENEWENEGGATLPDCDLCGAPNATYKAVLSEGFLCQNAVACLEHFEEKLRQESSS